MNERLSNYKLGIPNYPRCHHHQRSRKKKLRTMVVASNPNDSVFGGETRGQHDYPPSMNDHIAGTEEQQSSNLSLLPVRRQLTRNPTITEPDTKRNKHKEQNPPGAGSGHSQFKRPKLTRTPTISDRISGGVDFSIGSQSPSVFGVVARSARDGVSADRPSSPSPTVRRVAISADYDGCFDILGNC